MGHVVEIAGPQLLMWGIVLKRHDGGRGQKAFSFLQQLTPQCVIFSIFVHYHFSEKRDPCDSLSIVTLVTIVT
jgi:hypothetical protein